MLFIISSDTHREAPQAIATDGLPDPAGPGRWLVAYSRPRQEEVAHLNLTRQAFDVYLPMYTVYKRRERAIGREPMFPRYLFFRVTNDRQSVAKAKSTRGIAGVVQFGNRLASVPDSVIERVRLLEAARHEAMADPARRFLPRQNVLVLDGPFKGLEGLVDASTARRVELLMDVLGREVRVKIDPSSLAPTD